MGITSKSAYDQLSASLSNVFNEYVSDSWTAILADDQPKITAKDYNNSLPSKDDGWHKSYYGEVRRALGFTPQEIQHLVHANDSGLSFATLAALIEEHPPVYSSAMTPTRKAEEKAFCANVIAAVNHNQAKHMAAGFDFFNVPPKQQKYFVGGPKVYGPNDEIPNIYEGIAKTGGKSWVANKPSKHDWAAVTAQMMGIMTAPSKSYTTGKEQDSLDAIHLALAHGNTTFLHGLVLPPKPGELAKLLGIWTP